MSTTKDYDETGWIVLLYNGIGGHHCAIGPFAGSDGEERANKYAKEKGGRMPQVIPIYPPKKD